MNTFLYFFLYKILFISLQFKILFSDNLPKTETTKKEDQNIDRIYLDIHGRQLSFLEFEKEYQYYKDLHRYYQNKDNFTREAFKKQLIQEEIIKKLNERYQLKLNKNYIREFIDDQKQSFLKAAQKKKFKSSWPVHTEAYLDEYLKSKNYPPFPYFEMNIRNSYQYQQLIEHFIQEANFEKPNEKELRAFYMQHSKQFYRPAQVKIAHIVLSIQESDMNKYFLIKKKEDLAHRLHQRLIKNPKDFGVLSQKYSDDIKTKYHQGLIGWLSEEDIAKISPDYLIAFTLKPVNISNLIWTEKGIHIIKVLEKKAEHHYSFFEAKNFVEQRLLKEKAIKLSQEILDQESKFSYIITSYE